MYIKGANLSYEIAPLCFYFLDLLRYFLLLNNSIEMLSIIPKTDNITNTVSLVDENLLKVIIHINVAINNKISYILSI